MWLGTAAVTLSVSALSAALSAAPAGAVTVRTFSPGLTASSVPTRIVAARDGNLWFTEQNASKIGRITPSGSITEFPVASSPAGPLGIAASADGLLWFTKNINSRVARFTLSGAEFDLAGPWQPSPSRSPLDIVVGPDGMLWFAESANPGFVARFDPNLMNALEVPTPTANSFPFGIAVGSDGKLWFTEAGANKIGKITTAGAISEEPTTLPTASSGPRGIAAGPDGNLWFTELNGNKIGRITPAGTVTEFSVPTLGSQPASIVAGPDGNLWFTESNANQIGRITPSGTITEFPVPASSQPEGITAGPDGNLWFVMPGGNAIGRATTDAEPPRYTHGDLITVPANPSTAAPADIYPSAIEVAGLQGTVTEVSVRLNGVYHDAAGDLEALLVGPQGQKVLLLTDSLPSRDVATGPVITFDDDGVTSPSRLVSGIFKPILGTGFTANFANPAPAGPYASTLSTFDGTNANGTWKLFLQDDTANSFDGAISGGWSLDIQTVPDPVNVPGPTVQVPVPGPVITVPGPTTTVTGPPTTVTGPPVVVSPPVDTTKPTLRLGALAARMPQATFRKGFSLAVTPSEAVTLDVTMSLKPKRATLAAADELLVFERTFSATRATTLALKPSAKYLGRPKKSFAVVLRIVASDKSGNRTTLTKTITVAPDKKKRRR
jgi:streptogramin lyase